MKKAFLRTILLSLLLLTSNGSFADFKKINRGSNSWGSFAYVMAFVARDYVPGHAFVVWVKLPRNSTPKKLESYAYGLYPDNSKKAVLGTVPGKIVLENLGSLRSLNNGLVVAVTKQMYEYSLMNTQAMRSGNVPYHLTKESCVDFVKLVASSIGLSTSPTSGFKSLPQAFISKLKDMNN